MTHAEASFKENEWLEAVHEYHILDTSPDICFDDITGMASEVCGMPISLLSIIDGKRQWVKSHHGASITEASGDCAFLKQVVSSAGKVFVVTDAMNDARFSGSPLVAGTPNIVFYAGVALINPEGFAIGILCVIDNKPNKLNARQLEMLQSLGRQALCQLEFRRQTIQLAKKRDELKKIYTDIEKFSSIASHDLRSPLNNIISLTSILKDGYNTQLDEEGNEYIDFLSTAANQMSDLIGGMIDYSRSSQLLNTEREHIPVSELVEEVIHASAHPANITFNYDGENKILFTNVPALKQILLNLCNNAIKYNDKPKWMVNIKFSDDKEYYRFEVIDNGPGIAEQDQQRIFEVFQRVARKGTTGAGIGLTVAKKLVDVLGGEIKVVSVMGKGSTFSFSILK